jgi:hypothetical protein
MLRRMIIERRIQISGVLVIAGLIVELVTLKWSHPTAFLSFIFLGGFLIGTGILFYLYSLLGLEKPVVKKAKEEPLPLIPDEVSSTG